MIGFIRANLTELKSYTPHPGGESNQRKEHQRKENQRKENQRKERIDRLDTNESPYDLPEELKAKLAWLYQEAIENNRYPDGSQQELKEAIATYVNQSPFPLTNTTITANHLSIGNGSDELIRTILIATCLGGEGAVMVANPTFSMYGIIAKTLGIPVVEIERNIQDFSFNLEAAQQALLEQKSPPIRVIFLVHPNSPTGNLIQEKELNWLRSLPSDILVVIDEAYCEYSQTTLVGEIATHPNWLILRTFSKALRLASHRVGYGIAHPQIITALEKVRLPYNLPSFSQTAALVALNHYHQLLAVIPEIITAREKITTDLSQFPQFRIWPSAANFIYLRPQNPHLDLAEFTAKLKAKGTLIRHTGGGLRITVGTEAENHRTLANFGDLLS